MNPRALWGSARGQAICLLALAPAAVAAAGVQLDPVVVEMATSRKPVVLTAVNTGASALRLQAQVKAWREPDGQVELTPAEDLVVVPAAVTIAPQGKQIFRVALRNAAPSPVERSYRLLIEEVPDEAAPATAGLQFKFAYDLPVMVAPSTAIIESLAWSPCPPSAAAGAPTPAGGADCLRIDNTGNRRTKVVAIQLEVASGRDDVQLKSPTNILAGGSRIFHLERKTPGADPIRKVTVKTINGDLLEATPVRR